MKKLVASKKAVLDTYNAGFDSGIKDYAALQLEKTPTNIRFLIHENINIKMLSGIKSEFPLIKAYWQGYYDTIQGYQRNSNYE